MDSLFNVTPIVRFYNSSMFCCVLLCVHSSFAIISMGKTELVALFVFLVSHWLVGWFCCFTSQVNSYGHCGTVSSPYHTYSWAGLNKL